MNQTTVKSDGRHLASVICQLVGEEPGLVRRMEITFGVDEPMVIKVEKYTSHEMNDPETIKVIHCEDEAGVK